MKLSASLVLYNSKPAQFEAVIADYAAAEREGCIVVCDNSAVPLVSSWFSHPRVLYCHMGGNIGFGSAHNRAIELACPASDLHLILNPDIRFGPEVLARLKHAFMSDATLAVTMPQIRYPDGNLQRLCKLLPTPLDLLVRRFLPFPWLRRQLDARYELHALRQDVPSEVPTLSGCFLLARSRLLLEEGGFDDRFFMYMEDVDLVRRLAMRGRTVYTPGVAVVHEYAKGSYRNLRLLGHHLRSATLYFNKWGWFFDTHRRRINKTCLRRIALAATRP